MTLGPAFTRAERSGELVSAAAQGVEDLDDYVTQYQPLRFLAVLVPVLIAVVILVIDPLTVPILLVTGPLVLLFLALIGSRARAITERRFLELGWMSASFLDLLQGLPTLKMFGRSREQVETIRDVSSPVRQDDDGGLTHGIRDGFRAGDEHHNRDGARRRGDRTPARERGPAVQPGAGGTHAHAGVLLALAAALSALPRRSCRKGGSRPHLRDSRHGPPGTPAASAAPTADGRTSIYASSALPAPTIAAGRSALREFSLEVPAGSTVALVGETGAGKSTVASLLLRFIEPDSGTISAGGTPIQAFDLAEWRSQIAWVPQHPYLFHGSVADNIRLGLPGATDADVAAAAEAAAADRFIARLPERL